ncbi:hypothetical protein H2200_004992 [Cladophialophora chaetospira]|uniref:BTB domain-containing protein n=1 Tax=Cladophialophora chaetospira TaxID=386627 RepID=A0AA39CJ74_9EURO|nr:hypothetical protein H2200_004992 [Cladophialophora chaetospira]
MDPQERDQQETAPRKAKLVVVAEEGDALFEVGNDQNALDIRVSATATKTIRLPEDDPKVVLAFCDVVHHRVDDLDHLETDELVKLATFADMRLCTRVLRPWVLMRISRFIDTINREEGAYWRMVDSTYDAELIFQLQKLLPIVTLFGMERAFYKCSRIMISSFRLASIQTGVPASQAEAHPRVTEVQGKLHSSGGIHGRSS